MAQAPGYLPWVAAKRKSARSGPLHAAFITFATNSTQFFDGVQAEGPSSTGF